MKKLQATEYTYASARIRAMENRLVGRERVDVLVDLKSSEDVMVKLSEYGVLSAAEGEGSAPASGETLGYKREEMLTSLLCAACNEVYEAVPEPEFFAWFRYPYDCNNIKTVINCHIRGIDPMDMLFDFGTVSAEETVRLLTEGKCDAFPTAMAAAIGEAKEAYAKTNDPQQIDAILDKACYADMLTSAKASGNETILGWITTKIDLVNIMMCLRILRMKRGETGKIFMDTCLLEGGDLPLAFFDAAYEGGEEMFWSGLSSSQYSKYNRFVSAVERTDKSLSAIERCADNHWMLIVREGARVPFGAEVAGGYLVACEVAVKNIRIILAAKDAKLSSDVLRERIRDSYV